MIELAHFQITKNCNLRCHFCGQWGKKGFFADEVGSQVEFDKWLEVANELKSLRKDKLCDIILWGGEPLVSNNFDRLAYALKDMGFKLGIITNGVLLDKHIDCINDCISTVYVSLDGKGDVHDEIRGKGVYDTVLNSLKKITCENKIAMCVTSEKSLESLQDFAEDLYGVGIKKLYLQNLIYLNEEEISQYKKVMRDTFGIEAKFVNAWLGSSLNIDDKISAKCSGEFPIGIEFLKHSVEGCCLSCEKHFHIAWNGDVTFCTDHYDFSIGNVNDSSLVDMLNSDRAEKFRELINENKIPTCNHCSWRNNKSFYLP